MARLPPKVFSYHARISAFFLPNVSGAGRWLWLRSALDPLNIDVVGPHEGDAAATGRRGDVVLHLCVAALPPGDICSRCLTLSTGRAGPHAERCGSPVPW